MKKQLLLLVCAMSSIYTFSQAPVIDGDLMLCPYDNGTAIITSEQTYDSYQWYFKYWFLEGEFEAIPGAIDASFTYDWYIYDQALIKVEVMLDGVMYESNEIQIDSYAWTSLTTAFELGENAEFDPETQSILLCQGATFDVSINNPPYNANIVWYKNEVEIAGANQSSYTVTSPGIYKVTAAPDFCPNSTSTSLEINVVTNTDCTLRLSDQHMQNTVKIYPNPTMDEFNIVMGHNEFQTYQMIDVTGKIVASGTISNTQNIISVASLSKGLYIIQLIGENQISAHKIIKK